MGLWRILNAPIRLETKAAEPSGPAALASYSASAPVGGAVWRSWTTANAITQGLNQSGWLSACVRKIATAGASVPWYVERADSGGEWRRVVGHPLELLLRQPAPGISRQSYMERTLLHLLLGGNAVSQKVRAGGVPRELWPLLPDVVLPVTDQVGMLDYYQVQGIAAGRFAAGSDKINPKDVVHYQFTDPANPLWGMSPIQSAARAVDTEVAATAWNYNSLLNGSKTSGMLVIKGELTEDQYNHVVEMVKAKHEGPANAGRIWVLSGDASFTPTNATGADMEFATGRRFNREEICAVYGVPPQILGSEGASTYNNFETAEEVFWLGTVPGWLDLLANTLQVQLVPDFAEAGDLSDGRVDSLRIVYALDEVPSVQKIIRRKNAQVAKDYFSIGVPLATVNSVLRLGLPRVSGDEVGYLSAGLVPVGALSMPAESSPDGEQVP